MESHKDPGPAQSMGTVEKKMKKDEKYKEMKLEKGVETLFRTTLGNHNGLSQSIDSKANILLSISTIIISVSLTTIFPKLDRPVNHYLIIPTSILLIVSVLCVIFAILATRPSISKGAFTKKEAEERNVNLLFFGNFYKMPYPEYERAMNELIKDRESVYNSMIKDLYLLGIVLQKKYRLLRITYNVFMFGIIITVISFFIALKIAL
jgi:hypothetical protein